MAEDDTPENHQNEDGSSAAHHLRPSLSSSLGSASLKSNSSTNSSHSFSFPMYVMLLLFQPYLLKLKHIVYHCLGLLEFTV